MAGTKEIDYRSGVKKLTKLQFGTLKMDSASSKVLSKLLNETNEKLVEYFNEEFSNGSNDDDDGGQQFAQKAVEKTFIGNLKKHAVSEGQRQLVLYENGMMKYDFESEMEKYKSAQKPAAAKKPQKSSKTVVPHYQNPSLCFKSGIGKMAESSQPSLTMNSKAKEFLSQKMHQFAKMVATDVVNSAADTDYIEPIDLRRAIGDYLGDDVMKIAVSEGNRSLALYENGLLYFKPKKSQPKSSEGGNENAVQETPDQVRKKYRKMFRAGVKNFLEDFISDTGKASKGSKDGTSKGSKDGTSKGSKDGSKIEGRASKFLEESILSLANYLANQAAEECRRNGHDQMRDGVLISAVENTFPELLLQHALVQGNSDVQQYKSGFLKYKRKEAPDHKRRRSAPDDRSGSKKQKTGKSSKKGRSAPPLGKGQKGKSKDKDKKSKKKEGEGDEEESESKAKKPKKDIKLDFTTALLDLGPNVFPSMRVSYNKDTTNAIGNVLQDVCNVLIDKAVNKAGNAEEFELKFLRDIVKDIFPKEMSKHAISFGTNVLALSGYKDSP